MLRKKCNISFILPSDYIGIRCIEFIQQFVEVIVVKGNRQLTGFNLGDVNDVVNQVKEGFTGMIDVLNILCLVSITEVFLGK